MLSVNIIGILVNHLKIVFSGINIVFLTNDSITQIYLFVD